MRLRHITFTGIDNRTDIQDLVDIQREFPIAEFGMLASYHWSENGNRFRDPALLPDLVNYQRFLNLSLHVCGSAAHDAAIGNWIDIDLGLLSGHTGIFRRIQLNVADHRNNPHHLWSPPYGSLQELIVQQHNADDIALFRHTAEIYQGDMTKDRISVLLDGSGGRGVDTPLKVLHGVGKVGYAGGFNPDNVAEKLQYLLENVDSGMFWIDMESGVRTDDWFDTAKVRRVLCTCRDVINHYSKEN